MNIAFNITSTIDKIKEKLDAMHELDLNRVLIGIPAAYAERKAQEGEPPPKINNATIGYIMEHGAPEQNIPARPFLVPGVKNIQNEAVARMRSAGQAALSGNKGAIDKLLNSLGALGRDSVKQKITDGPFAPLAPATIKARLRRRRSLSLGKRQKIYASLQPGDMRPLIDTGNLQNSINYVIRRK